MTEGIACPACSATRLDIEFEARGETLRVRPVGWITTALRDDLTGRKPGLLPCSCGGRVCARRSGRCRSSAPCSVASELFYLEVPNAAGDLGAPE